ncbi:hypothetical protein SH1V18_38110 [Vallitalea longa]|uniref:Uncharacterized protein n=2 Tax=Vallitalea longa TaxID=2936439 RepID=A0A9W5YEQ2_9FIRM|nr:hypothetical protein SH1V18_38110 [Vallitalea longa]
MIFANTVLAMESTDTKSDEIVKDDKLLKEYIQLGKNFLNQYYSSIAEKKAFDKLSYIHKNELKK